MRFERAPGAFAGAPIMAPDIRDEFFALVRRGSSKESDFLNSAGIGCAFVQVEYQEEGIWRASKLQ
jgi:hypothetical protein